MENAHKMALFYMIQHSLLSLLLRIYEGLRIYCVSLQAQKKIQW